MSNVSVPNLWPWKNGESRFSQKHWGFEMDNHLLSFVVDLTTSKSSRITNHHIIYLDFIRDATNPWVTFFTDTRTYRNPMKSCLSEFPTPDTRSPPAARLYLGDATAIQEGFIVRVL